MSEPSCTTGAPVCRRAGKLSDDGPHASRPGALTSSSFADPHWFPEQRTTGRQSQADYAVQQDSQVGARRPGQTGQCLHFALADTAHDYTYCASHTSRSQIRKASRQNPSALLSTGKGAYKRDLPGQSRQDGLMPVIPTTTTSPGSATRLHRKCSRCRMEIRLTCSSHRLEAAYWHLLLGSILRAGPPRRVANVRFQHLALLPPRSSQAS